MQENFKDLTVYRNKKPQGTAKDGFFDKIKYPTFKFDDKETADKNHREKGTEYEAVKVHDFKEVKEFYQLQTTFKDEKYKKEIFPTDYSWREAVDNNYLSQKNKFYQFYHPIVRFYLNSIVFVFNTHLGFPKDLSSLVLAYLDDNDKHQVERLPDDVVPEENKGFDPCTIYITKKNDKTLAYRNSYGVYVCSEVAKPEAVHQLIEENKDKSKNGKTIVPNSRESFYQIATLCKYTHSERMADEIIKFQEDFPWGNDPEYSLLADQLIEEAKNGKTNELKLKTTNIITKSIEKQRSQQTTGTHTACNYNILLAVIYAIEIIMGRRQSKDLKDFLNSYSDMKIYPRDPVTLLLQFFTGQIMRTSGNKQTPDTTYFTYLIKHPIGTFPEIYHFFNLGKALLLSIILPLKIKELADNPKQDTYFLDVPMTILCYQYAGALFTQHNKGSKDIFSPDNKELHNQDKLGNNKICTALTTANLELSEIGYWGKIGFLATPKDGKTTVQLYNIRHQSAVLKLINDFMGANANSSCLNAAKDLRSRVLDTPPSTIHQEFLLSHVQKLSDENQDTIFKDMLAKVINKLTPDKSEASANYYTPG